MSKKLQRDVTELQDGFKKFASILHRQQEQINRLAGILKLVCEPPEVEPEETTKETTGDKDGNK